jgi:CRISPR-associated protein Cas5d
LRDPGNAAAPIGKHLDMFNRRARKGQCFHRPCLGTREFDAEFALIDGEPPRPHGSLIGKDVDLGWMALDIDFARGGTPLFFKAGLARPGPRSGGTTHARSRPGSGRGR